MQRKTLLVTGGGSGIGLAIAERLGRDGDHIVIADINSDAGPDAVARVEAAGGSVEYHSLDVADEPAVQALIADVAARRGKLDGACNNAGIEGPTAKLTDLSVTDWERTLRVNLTGVFVCVKAEVQQMRAQGDSGAIVNIASVAGLVGIAGSASYNASKSGVIGLTRTAALETAGRGIRVNAVCPGFVETPMLDRVTDSSALIADRLIANVPARRVASPHEIANAVAWLLGDESSYVTGVALPVDGGWVAQ